jgi:hypothetical protein
MHFSKILLLAVPTLVFSLGLFGCSSASEDNSTTAEPKAAKKKMLSKADLPGPVQATLDSESQGCTIGDIEEEKEGGKVVYEIEISCNGTAYELEIAQDGKLIEKELEEEDEKDDEDEDEDDDDEDDE